MRFLVGGCKNNLKNDKDVNIAVNMWNSFCLGIEKFYSGVKQHSDWFYSVYEVTYFQMKMQHVNF